jgi:hypothetical protein
MRGLGCRRRTTSFLAYDLNNQREIGFYMSTAGVREIDEGAARCVRHTQ